MTAFGERLHAGRIHDGCDLPLDDRARLTRLALLEGFADADDRHEPGGLRGLELRRDDGVRLAIERAALGVPHDHVAAADVAQHLPRDLARVRARRRLVGDVLRAEGDRAALQPAVDGRQIDVRRAQQHRRPARRP